MCDDIISLFNNNYSKYYSRGKSHCRDKQTIHNNYSNILNTKESRVLWMESLQSYRSLNNTITVRAKLVNFSHSLPSKNFNQKFHFTD